MDGASPPAPIVTRWPRASTPASPASSPTHGARAPCKPTRDLVSGRGGTARMLPGGQGGRRAAAGEAGAADLPEGERVTGDDVSAARQTTAAQRASTFAAPASPAAARPAHSPLTPHARVRFRPETRVSGRLLLEPRAQAGYRRPR